MYIQDTLIVGRSLGFRHFGYILKRIKALKRTNLSLGSYYDLSFMIGLLSDKPGAQQLSAGEPGAEKSGEIS